MYTVFAAQKLRRMKGTVQHVRINGEHRIIAANGGFDHSEGPMGLWNYDGQRLHTVGTEMHLGTNCGLETQFDMIAVPQIYPNKLRVGKITDTGIRYTWQDTQAWIDPELSAQWKVELDDDSDDEDDNPITCIQILNNDLLLTSYQQGMVALHDIRTPSRTNPPVHYHVAGPQDSDNYLMGAYALHGGTRATMINSIQDATRVVVGCGGTCGEYDRYTPPQLCVYDMRMLQSTDATPSSSTATTSGDAVERVQLPKGMRTMDVSGSMVAIAGADKINPEEYDLYGSGDDQDYDPLFEHGFTTLIKGRSCAVQLWNVQQPLSKGPVAVNRTPNECSESRRRSPARLSDDGKHVYVPQRDGSVFSWGVCAGKGGKKVLQECMPISVDGTGGFGDERDFDCEPYWGEDAYDRFHVDASGDLLVMGGYGQLVIVELEEGMSDPL